MKLGPIHPVKQVVVHEAVQLAGWTNNTHDAAVFAKMYDKGAELKLFLCPRGVQCEWLGKDGKRQVKVIPDANIREMTLVNVDEE